MDRPFDPRFRAVKTRGRSGIEEDVIPEGFSVVLVPGIVTVGKEGCILVYRMGATRAGMAVEPGPCIGPHSLKLFSEREGCYIAVGHMAFGQLCGS